MKISKSLECPGFFWSPEEPDVKQAGVLCISEFGDIDVRITSLLQPQNFGTNDTQRQGIAPDKNNKDFIRIVGIIQLDNKSILVTLEDCFYSYMPNPYSEGVATTKIVANTAYFGVNYAADDEITFSKVTFSVELLDEWFGSSGIQIEDKNKEDNVQRSINLKYSSPTIKFTLPNNECEVELIFEHRRSSSLGKFEFKQKVYISLTYNSLHPLKEFQNLVYKIQCYLCFAIDHAVSLNYLEGHSDNITQDIGDNQTITVPIRIYYKSIPINKFELKRSWLHMLLPFRQIGEKFEQSLIQWLDAYEKYEPAIELYFASVFGTSKHLEVKFLLLMQGIEVLDRRRSNDTEFDRCEFEKARETMINCAPTKMQPFIRVRLQFANEISLRKRLKRMFEPFSNYFFDTPKNRRSFIRKAVNTRNYHTHFNEDLKDQSFNGKDLIKANNKLEGLFQLHLLQLLGLRSAEIDNIVNNHYPLKYKFQN